MLIRMLKRRKQNNECSYAIDDTRLFGEADVTFQTYCIVSKLGAVEARIVVGRRFTHHIHHTAIQ